MKQVEKLLNLPISRLYHIFNAFFLVKQKNPEHFIKYAKDILRATAI